jgi:predicted HD phosphohydrolase
MTAPDPIQVIADLFASDGASEYLGEPVTQAAHMLQAAALAQQCGAPRPWSRPRSCTTSAISPRRSAATT